MFGNKDLLLALGKGIAVGLACGLAVLLAASILMTYISLDDIFTNALTSIAIAVITYVSSHHSAQLCRQKGLFQGIVCSAVIMIPMAIISMAANGYLSDYCIFKLIIAAVFGIAGGIIGINTKKTKIR